MAKFVSLVYPFVLCPHFLYDMYEPMLHTLVYMSYISLTYLHRLFSDGPKPKCFVFRPCYELIIEIYATSVGAQRVNKSVFGTYHSRRRLAFSIRIP